MRQNCTRAISGPVGHDIGIRQADFDENCTRAISSRGGADGL